MLGLKESRSPTPLRDYVCHVVKDPIPPSIHEASLVISHLSSHFIKYDLFSLKKTFFFSCYHLQKSAQVSFLWPKIYYIPVGLKTMAKEIKIP